MSPVTQEELVPVQTQATLQLGEVSLGRREILQVGDLYLEVALEGLGTHLAAWRTRDSAQLALVELACLGEGDLPAGADPLESCCVTIQLESQVQEGDSWQLGCRSTIRLDLARSKIQPVICCMIGAGLSPVLTRVDLARVRIQDALSFHWDKFTRLLQGRRIRGYIVADATYRPYPQKTGIPAIDQQATTVH